MEWRTIKVPREFYIVLKTRAKSEGMSLWKFINKTFSFYYSVYHDKFNPKDVDRARLNVQKISWYVYKLSQSIGAFKENPSDYNFNQLMSTINDVKKRLGVNTDVLEIAINQYKKKPSHQNKININESSRAVITDIIMKIFQ